MMMHRQLNFRLIQVYYLHCTNGIKKHTRKHLILKQLYGAFAFYAVQSGTPITYKKSMQILRFCQRKEKRYSSSMFVILAQQDSSVWTKRDAIMFLTLQTKELLLTWDSDLNITLQRNQLTEIGKYKISSILIIMSYKQQ